MAGSSSRLSRSPVAALCLCAGLLVLAAPAVARAGWKDASQRVQAALHARDADGLRQGIREVAADQSVRAVKLLMQVAVAGRDLDSHDALLEGLSSQRDAGAVKTICKQVASHRDWTVRYLLVEALVGLPPQDGHAALFKAFSDREASVAALAMRLAAEHKLKASIPKIIERLEVAEKKGRSLDRVRQAALLALGTLTGEDLQDAFSWSAWWKVNSDRFDPSAVERRKESSGSTSSVLRKIEKRGDQKFLEKLEKGDIYCITGDFDHVENVLGALKLPHTVIKRKDLDKEIAKIPPTAVIVFNCSGGGDVSAAALARIGQLVKAGAYLFTSDWELETILMKAVPGQVSMGATTGEHEFPIQMGKGGRGHPYMRDVFPDNPYQAAAMKWQIDGASYCVKPGNGVITLVACAELQKAYGSEIVACTFRYGKGSVLHVLSHFDKQSDASGDGFALQQMLMNFIVEKQRFRAAKNGKKKRRP